MVLRENKGYGIYITAIRSASSITTNIVTEKIAVNALMIFSFIFSLFSLA